MVVVLSFVAAPLFGQVAKPNTAWFGLTPPGNPENPPIHDVVEDPCFQPASPIVPVDDPSAPELAGDRIFRDLEAIVDFSLASRERGDRLWGRVSGFRSGKETILWAAEEFREAGIAEVSVQNFSANAEMWWPESWSVTLLADSAYGAGSTDVTLESALPLSGSTLVSGPVEAPLIEIASGDGYGSDFATVDVLGKVAVQRIRFVSRADAEWQWAERRARSLIGRGALGVINVVDLPGNMLVREGECRGPCFNLGAADGEFLLRVIRRARAAGVAEPTIRLTLNAASRAGLAAANAVAVVPGETTEVIVITADADGWFDAAGDNGDGLAVMMALARHFARSENAPRRTLVFVASAGRHSRGLDGPANFMRMNRGVVRDAVLVLSLGDLARFRMTRHPWRLLPAEEEITIEIADGARFLDDVIHRGAARYGLAARIQRDLDDLDDGDLETASGGFTHLDATHVDVNHTSPVHFTSGDVIETISVPGLERAARFFAYFIRQVDAAPTRMFDP